MMQTAIPLPRGPVMIDVAAFSLTAEERARLCHPLVGGVILFRRNFQNIAQLQALTAEIRALRSPHLLIAVDHEGGRVQRFIDGFTRLPPMRALGEAWDANPEKAQSLVRQVGYVLAAELRACGVDLSFTPVLDLDWGRAAVIGNRSFHRDPTVVTELALALQAGLAAGGMATCGKHFPGHGFASGDSHLTMPFDDRTLAQLQADDLQPFACLADAGMAAVMPAHVVYPAVDSLPAGFSRRWLQEILRDELGFDGVIFSDDLTMEGAAGAGGITSRAQAAFSAGCDMALVCNRPDLADELLVGLVDPQVTRLAAKLARMVGQGEQADWQALLLTDSFATSRSLVQQLTVPADVLAGPKVGEAS